MNDIARHTVQTHTDEIGGTRHTLERELSEHPQYLWIGPKTEIMVLLIKGSPRAFHSICPHMGARLQLDPSKKAVTCPWHGLRYDTASLSSEHHRYKKLCEIKLTVVGREIVVGGSR